MKHVAENKYLICYKTTEMTEQVYIAILRGINVAGKNTVAMEHLKQLFSENGFEGAVTYIQSGNVVFKSAVAKDQLAALISRAIEVRFQLNIHVILVTKNEMGNIIKDNPFLEEKDVDEEKLHVTILEKNPDPENLKAIQNLDFKPDRFIVKNNVVYLYCPNGYGKTKLSNTFFENKLKIKASTRNWRTINKLIELASQFN